MMATEAAQAGYKPFQQAEIVDIKADKTVTIRMDNKDIDIRVNSGTQNRTVIKFI